MRTDMKSLRISASVLKVLLGMMFVISAVSKFITIDAFEMYVFSFGLFPLSVSLFLARLVLSVELVLGAALISHRHHRFTVLSALLFLLCFIVFLVYAHLIGRTDNCHCFGDLMPFDPLQSIVKNAVLVVLLLFVYKYALTDWAPRWWLSLVVCLLTALAMLLYMVKSLHAIDILSFVLLLVVMAVCIVASFSFHSRWYVTAMLVAAPFVATFILTPPDNWFYNDTNSPFDKELFLSQLSGIDEGDSSYNVAITDSSSVPLGPALHELGLGEGRHLVAFFSPGCGYCRLAAGKIAAMAKRHDLPEEGIIYVFPQVKNASSYDNFYAESRSPRYRQSVIDKNLFVHITRGAFPTVLLIEADTVAASLSYRDINENLINEFFEL